jgi:hypothetical protein
MSDHFSPLRTLEVESTPLPVEDVMRAGTRRRRTRHAANLVGAGALVAAVIAGGVQLTGGVTEPDSAPPAGPSSGYIPEDFALGADLPVASQQADLRGAAEVPPEFLMPAVCGTGYVLAGTPLDRLVIEGTNQQYTGMRDLAVLGSTAEAQQAVEEQVARFEACPTEGTSPRTRTTVEPVDLGDRAWRVQRTTVFDGFVSGVEVWYLVQQGPATLVVTDYLDQPEELERVGARVREIETDGVVPVVEQLCSVRTVC